MLKTILSICLIVILGVSAYYFYNSIQDLSGKQIGFVVEKANENQSSYSSSLQFYPNMRFKDNKISYLIDNSCNSNKRSRMLDAFSIISNRTSLVFYASENPQVEVRCEENQTNFKPGEYYIAGEGGPTLLINTSLFNIIEKGEILLLYKKESCDASNVEIHELLHVLGFDHSQNNESIMFPTVACNQVITLDILKEINRLYAIEQKPDLYFENITALKHGIYLDFFVAVANKGLAKAENASLELYSTETKFSTFNLGDIDIGEIKTLEVKNSKLPNRDIQQIRFAIIDSQDLDNVNNIAKLSVAG